MNKTKHLLEGVKVMALLAAVALVVWNMPNAGGLPAGSPDASGDWQSISDRR